MALQLNVKIEKSDGMEYIFQNLSTIYFPVIWFETSVDLPQGMASALKLLVNIPKIMVVASIIGILLGMLGILMVFRRIVIVRTDSEIGEEETKRFRPWEGKINLIKNLLAFKKYSDVD